MKRVLLLLLALNATTLWAQDYLVTARKDTLRGKLSIISIDKVDNVTIRIDKKKTDYAAYTVLMAFMDSVIYVPVRKSDSFRMMKLGKKGLLSLCYERQSPGMPYNIPYLVKKSGESMEAGALRFKKSVSKFLEDCGTIKLKIEAGELGRDDLEKLVDSYNSCLEQQSTVAFVETMDPKLSALNAFNQKLSKDDTVPAEAREILKDLYTKVKSGGPVPNYLAEGLRETLKDLPAYQEDVEKLLAVLKN